MIVILEEAIDVERPIITIGVDLGRGVYDKVYVGYTQTFQKYPRKL